MPNGAHKFICDGVKYYYIPFPSKDKVKHAENLTAKGLGLNIQTLISKLNNRHLDVRG